MPAGRFVVQVMVDRSSKSLFAMMLVGEGADGETGVEETEGDDGMTVLLVVSEGAVLDGVAEEITEDAADVVTREQGLAVTPANKRRAEMPANKIVCFMFLHGTSGCQGVADTNEQHAWQRE
jgi:hypothetical protein